MVPNNDVGAIPYERNLTMAFDPQNHSFTGLGDANAKEQAAEWFRDQIRQACDVLPAEHRKEIANAGCGLFGVTSVRMPFRVSGGSRGKWRFAFRIRAAKTPYGDTLVKIRNDGTVNDKLIRKACTIWADRKIGDRRKANIFEANTETYKALGKPGDGMSNVIVDVDSNVFDVAHLRVRGEHGLTFNRMVPLDKIELILDVFTYTDDQMAGYVG